MMQGILGMLRSILYSASASSGTECPQTFLDGSKARNALVQEVAGPPMERCGINLSGPWLLSKEGNQYLCVLQDYFSNWIEVYAMPVKTALSVAKCLVKFMAR